MQTLNPVFQQLMQDPNNSCCFECNSKSVQWASVTNGLFICMNCSGMHRGFGVELSFVRSITIDEWDEKRLSFMRQGGNRRLREFLAKYDVDMQEKDKVRKYKTRACRYYREMQKSEVEGGPEVPLDFDIEEGNVVIEPKKILLNSYGGYGSDPLPSEDSEEGMFSKQGIKDKFKTAGEFMGKQGDSLKKNVGELKNKMENANTGEAIKSGFWGGLGKLKQAGNFLGSKTSEVYNTSKSGIKTAGSKISEKSNKVFDKVGEKTKEKFSKVAEVTKEGWGIVSKNTKEGVTYITEKSKDLYKDGVDITEKGIDRVKAMANQDKQRKAETETDLYNNALETPQNPTSDDTIVDIPITSNPQIPNSNSNCDDLDMIQQAMGFSEKKVETNGNSSHTKMNTEDNGDIQDYLGNGNTQNGGATDILGNQEQESPVKNNSEVDKKIEDLFDMNNGKVEVEQENPNFLQWMGGFMVLWKW